mmetsp:Transcript_129115/g.306315  ORF Transcript_129115/g.306315 Transcript_129115/m.306315 type:complete len:210 (-) Transcript_129115:260-889(-)
MILSVRQQADNQVGHQVLQQGFLCQEDLPEGAILDLQSIAEGLHRSGALCSRLQELTNQESEPLLGELLPVRCLRIPHQVVHGTDQEAVQGLNKLQTSKLPRPCIEKLQHEGVPTILADDEVAESNPILSIFHGCRCQAARLCNIPVFHIPTSADRLDQVVSEGWHVNMLQQHLDGPLLPCKLGEAAENLRPGRRWHQQVHEDADRVIM